jgi:toxin ParE1/3/4
VTGIVYTAAAERDLTEISLNIAADDPRAASRFVERIRERCEHLERFPIIGRQRAEIHPGIRSMPLGSYVIFFQHNDQSDQVRILRIWHSRRKAPTPADLL